MLAGRAIFPYVFFQRQHKHRKLHPYLQLQHGWQRHEHPDHDHGSAMISTAILHIPRYHHVAIADMDATYSASVAAENNTFHNTSNNNRITSNIAGAMGARPGPPWDPGEKIAKIAAALKRRNNFCVDHPAVKRLSKVFLEFYLFPIS